MIGLIHFRWIAIVCLLLGMVPLLKWDYLEPQRVPYFVAVLLLLSFFNILSQSIWKVKSEQKNVLVHLTVDLLAAAGILFVSGSALNPFTSILCVHAFLGGMLLQKRYTYLFGIVLMLLLGLLQFETFMEASVRMGKHVDEMILPFMSQWVLIAGSWFVSYYFSHLLHKNELRIRALQNQQHQADRLKALGALTAGFSHQLATPMNSLNLRMERGIRKLDFNVAEAKEEFAKAEISLAECLKVFRHMASVFSRSANTELQSVEIQKVLTELLDVWEKENQVSVERLLIESPLICRIQLLAFSQTFFDLLDNALEASDEKSKISVRLYRKENDVVLEVVDQGGGLSEEMLSRLGEPFVTSKVHGNGLGLYSAGMMAQASGGAFKIFNNQSRGATAQITLPEEQNDGSR